MIYIYINYSRKLSLQICDNGDRGDYIRGLRLIHSMFQSCNRLLLLRKLPFCLFPALHLSPDVAGATFMAAGSSAPELATSVIGVFVAKDDIGVSGVVGSAVFNITLVIGVCALSAQHAITLSWYSLCRRVKG